MQSFWHDKNVLITGASGFLGSHVRKKLSDAGCQNIYSFRSSEYDLTKEDNVVRLFTDVTKSATLDVVIHLAGLVGGIGANKAAPALFFYQNIMMSVLTMHYSWQFGAKRFVAAGAGCGYPEEAPCPLREEFLWQGFPQRESAAYSLAKRMLHVQSEAYWTQYSFPSVITIPGNIYGPFDNFDLEQAHVIPALVRKFVEATESNSPTVVVWGNGKSVRDFVYAGDVADGILRAAQDYNASTLVNLSSGIGTSISEVVEMLIDITAFKGRIVWDNSRPNGQSSRYFDVSKAKRDLDWEARTTLYKGLQQTVEWYRSGRLS